mmetsp:Transcript_54167/g.100049  ORF Transcript_54167/g.100049 Transcript_54167/m.100049 type:complete len:178 (-) Transcript_54167:51-584(-)
MAWTSLRETAPSGGSLDLDSDIELTDVKCRNNGTDGGSAGSLREQPEVLTAEADELHQAKRARTSAGKRGAKGEAAEKCATTALDVAANEVFDVLTSCAAQGKEVPSGEACITPDALRVALARFRIPVEKCRDDEVDDLLLFAAEKVGASPASLSRPAFRELVSTLGLRVTKDGKVW